MNKCIIKIALPILLFCIGWISAGTTGKLSGTIKSKSDNGPLIGANVIIVNTDLGTATDQNGDYVILNIAPGKYNVIIRMIGHEVKIYENIQNADPHEVWYIPHGLMFSCFSPNKGGTTEWGSYLASNRIRPGIQDCPFPLA